jgi:hypothetical protein
VQDKLKHTLNEVCKRCSSRITVLQNKLSCTSDLRMRMEPCRRKSLACKRHAQTLCELLSAYEIALRLYFTRMCCHLELYASQAITEAHVRTRYACTFRLVGTLMKVGKMMLLPCLSLIVMSVPNLAYLCPCCRPLLSLATCTAVPSTIPCTCAETIKFPPPTPQ